MTSEDEREQEGGDAHDERGAGRPELGRGCGREDSREQEPDRRRELEAGVLPEQDTGCRERVQAEEACARDQRE